MTRDEVIKGMECCTATADCKGCPYDRDDVECVDVLMRDAIALLKAESVVRCDECEYAGFGDCLLTAGAQLDGCLRGKRRLRR